MIMLKMTAYICAQKIEKKVITVINQPTGFLKDKQLVINDVLGCTHTQ